jgi:hypothetical protein
MKTLADINRANRAVAKHQSDNIHLFAQGKARDAVPYQPGTYTKAGLKSQYLNIMQELNGNITSAKRAELEATLEEIEDRLSVM